jgi:uncharacterized membrane protein
MILPIILVFSALGDGLHFFSFIVQFWKFILSSDYRRKKNIEWREKRSMLVAQDIIMLFLGFLVSVLLIILVGYMIIQKQNIE